MADERWKKAVMDLRNKICMVVKEAFDETDLVNGVYTLTKTDYDDIIEFNITNNSTTNSLSFTIDDVTITVDKGESWKEIFNKKTTITVAGTSLDFDAFIKG